MDKYKEKKINIVYDSVYDLKSKGVNNKLDGYLSLVLTALEDYAKEYNREFKLNQKTQKFRLYKIK